jgi:K+-sensing histidine kinase KdpD
MLLRKGGVPVSAVQTLFCEPGEPEETADTLLRMANECQCRTVVVGRQSVSWFHELFSQDMSEELLRRGKGFCVWAVE